MNLPNKTTDDITHCQVMRAWAESHPKSGDWGVDIGWADWYTEEQLLRERLQRQGGS